MEIRKPLAEGLSRRYKLLVASIASAFLSIAIIGLCFYSAPNRQSGSVSVLIGIVGMLAGWIVAVALTPYSKEEERRFSISIGVFASGYMIAKIDKVLIMSWTLTISSRLDLNAASEC